MGQITTVYVLEWWGAIVNFEGNVLIGGTISVADLHSINWFVKAVEDLSATSPQKVEEQFTPEKMTELSNGLRNNKSIVQLVCET